MPVIPIRFEFLRPGAGLALLATLCVLAGRSANAAAVPVMLNEILANNRSFTNASGATPDWVELFNPSPAALDLGGMSLSDSLATPQRWVFPANAVIAAGSYQVIDCDGGAPPSAVNTGFGLKAEGDTLYLIDSPARGSNVLDEVAFGLQVADLTSKMRETDPTFRNSEGIRGFVDRPTCKIAFFAGFESLSITGGGMRRPGFLARIVEFHGMG